MGTLLACNGGDGTTVVEDTKDSFDRAVMLKDWADGIIIPAYEAYARSLEDLQLRADEFVNAADVNTLRVLRESWREAYIHWQYVSMFEIGKAEELQLRNFSNIFPADVAAIENNIGNGNYTLTLPSSIDEQGFPALDYLINGLAEDDISITLLYSGQSAYSEYLLVLVERLNSLTKQVLDDWKTGYREHFIDNVASSATGSVDKLVNDYVYYYERHLRAGKVGIPAGIFSGKPEPQTVEALYDEGFAKTLLNHALNAVQNFFNGIPVYDGYEGQSLAGYLDYLNSIKTGADLSALINAQFENARKEIAQLNDNFVEQINANNIEMLEVYDQLQLNVVLLKVDMMQALNVRVDFVDADGD